MGKTRGGIIIHSNGFMGTSPPVVGPACWLCWIGASSIRTM